MTALPTRPSTQSSAVNPQICIPGRDFAGSLNQLERAFPSFVRWRRVAPRPCAEAAPTRRQPRRTSGAAAHFGRRTWRCGAAAAVLCTDERRAGGAGMALPCPGCAGVSRVVIGWLRLAAGAASGPATGPASGLAAGAAPGRALGSRRHPLTPAGAAISPPGATCLTRHPRASGPTVTTQARTTCLTRHRPGVWTGLSRCAGPDPAPARGRCKTQQSGHIHTR
jgi:hypothetical protein